MSFLEGLLWLTLNVYHEARNEPAIGQRAVAHVTLNRAIQQNATLEEVVTAPYQFSWFFQKQSFFPKEPNAFFNCLQSSLTALTNDDFTDGATHYHRYDVHPGWAGQMHYIARYGTHKFYRN